MLKQADRNLVYGSCLTVFGAVLSLGSHLVLNSVPLTAMGIGLAVLGAAWAMTPPNPLPRKTVASLVESSCSNIEALLEALGAVEKAVYIPLKDGRVVAYVPIKKAGDAALRDVAENAGRILVRLGGSLGVVVTPPMAEAGNPHPLREYGSDVDSLMDHVLVEPEIVQSARAAQSGDTVVVEARRLRVDVEYSRFRTVMGSLSSCIAAQAVASALFRPVQVAEEKRDGDRLTFLLRILDWTDKAYT